MFNNNTTKTTKNRKGLNKILKDLSLFCGLVLGSGINLDAMHTIRGGLKAL